MTSNTHVSLIGEQVAPNYYPYLDPDFRPRRLVLLATERTRHIANRLQRLLQPRGVGVQIIPLGTPMDAQSVSDVVLEILTERPDEKILLNATGGTKPMMLGAVDAFRAASADIYYIDGETGNVQWVYPRRPPTPIDPQIRISTVLEAHGYSIIAGRDSVTRPESRAAALEAGKNIARYPLAFPELNRLVENREFNSNGQLLTKHDVSDSARKYADIFVRHGIVAWRGDHLEFRKSSVDQDARFIQGGWVEQFVFDQLHPLQGRAIQDLAMNVKIADEEGAENELDVAFVAHQKLYIIECKLRRTRSTHPEGADFSTPAIHRLEALRPRLGGLSTRALLVSGGQFPEHMVSRARATNVELIHGMQLSGIRSIIERMVRTQHA